MKMDSKGELGNFFIGMDIHHKVSLYTSASLSQSTKIKTYIKLYFGLVWKRVRNKFNNFDKSM